MQAATLERNVEEMESIDTGLTVAVFVDPVESAKAAGLRYVTDDIPGIRRRKCGQGGRRSMGSFSDLRGSRWL